ncbi:TlpA family protein disulfide reductase [Pedobacter yulinensis]|uniref:TlpA family protein disulfide reductase n=1 Tax=Pedobacter yulinensis TaxID=2126353 RepID=A0A2T3HNK2_9SPHI|nr:TlpA disulfide reductase family protein [Pedobacter yulinensis]PST84006.1 TlpA family protein disulfide reductase [Pedobacter yulinensis]
MSRLHLNRKLTGRILNLLVLALLTAVLFMPGVRPVLMRGLMQLGLFRPNTREQPAAVAGLDAVRFRGSGGQAIDLTALRGKVVFINFWASWCPPCIAEMPALEALYHQFKNDERFVFLFVDADGNLEAARKFLDERQWKIPAYIAASAVPDELLNGTLPTTVIFDKRGRRVFRHEGLADYSSRRFKDYLSDLANRSD